MGFPTKSKSQRSLIICLYCHFIEPLSPIQKHPPYRKSGKNKCHSEKPKKGYTKLDGDKGYIKFPCNTYKDSYALKHWQLGKSWTNFLEYEIHD